MKKAKKLLAMALGTVLLMGCLSVSAATEELTVTENDTHLLYHDDFSAETLDGRVTIGASATFDTETDRITLSGAGGNLAKVYFNENKAGLIGQVITEFTIVQYGAHDYDNQIQIALINSKGAGINDIRVYTGNTPFIGIVNTSAARGFEQTIDKSLSNLTFKISYNTFTRRTAMWFNGEQILAEEDSAELDRFGASNGGNVAGFNVDLAGAGGSVSLKKVTFSTVATTASPAVWQDEYHEDFDSNTAVSADKVTTNTFMTYAWEDGALKVTCPSDVQEKNTVFNFSDTPLTGRYVVETRISSCSGAYRWWYGVGQTNVYVQWSAGETGTLTVRTFDPSSAFVLGAVSVADYNAQNSLKISAHYDSDAGTVDFYFNDVFGCKITYTDKARASIQCLTLVEYPGTVVIDDVRVYRPVEGLMVEEVDGGVRLAAETAQAARLIAATYGEADGAKTLSAVAAGELTLEPGKIYTASTAAYAGGSFYLWDAALKPLQAVMPIPE